MEREEETEIIKDEDLKHKKPIQFPREKREIVTDQKSDKAVNYIKAFSLLSSMKLLQNRLINTSNGEDEEHEVMLRVVKDLKMRLISERHSNEELKIYHLIESVFMVVVILALLSVVLGVLLQD